MSRSEIIQRKVFANVIVLILLGLNIGMIVGIAIYKMQLTIQFHKIQQHNKFVDFVGPGALGKRILQLAWQFFASMLQF